MESPSGSTNILPSPLNSATSSSGSQESLSGSQYPNVSTIDPDLNNNNSGNMRRLSKAHNHPSNSSKVSLLSTSVLACTKEVVNSAKDFYTLIGIKEKKFTLQEQKDLKQKLTELIVSINNLLEAAGISKFRIETLSEKKVKGHTQQDFSKLTRRYNRLWELCHQGASKGASHSQSIERNKWDAKDLDSLKDNLKKLIQTANGFLTENTITYIKLTDEQSAKEKLWGWIHKPQLKFSFTSPEQKQAWSKVNAAVDTYLKKEILLELKNHTFTREHSHILEQPSTKELFDEYMKEESAEGKLRLFGPLVTKYHVKLLALIEDFKNLQDNHTVENAKHISELKKIFKHASGNKYEKEFFLAIAHSLSSQYLENLETLGVGACKTILIAEKVEGIEIDCEDSKDTHTSRLLKGSIATAEERLRALTSNNLWLRNQKKEILLHPPDCPPGLTSLQQMEKVEGYLPETEGLISWISLKDSTKSFLTKFRLLGYEMLTQGSKKEAEFEQHFIALQGLLINDEKLDSHSELILGAIKTMLEQSFPGLLVRRSLKKICIDLCTFYQSDPKKDDVTNKHYLRCDNLIQTFREKLSEIKQNVYKKVYVLDMNELIFKTFAPVMQKLETDSLSEEEKGLLKHVENQLKETNKEVIEKYGIKKIGKFLFQLHRILNQAFSTYALSMLKIGISKCFPKDIRCIYSLNQMIESSKYVKSKDTQTLSTKQYVDLHDDGSIHLEWQNEQHLSSDDWLFTTILKIVMPSIDSEDTMPQIYQEYQFNPKDPKKIPKTNDGSGLLKALLKEPEVLERVMEIRYLLKAMNFPVDSLYTEAS